MLGAILGDVIGSPYEFDHNNIKTMDFPLFSERSGFTDDTVMTLAVAEGMILGFGDCKATETAIVESMRRYGNLYPDAGYGTMFSRWLQDPDPKPYNSFGNGAAMRVSPIGWMLDRLDQVEEFARISAFITHNHPEGIKGAMATAATIFLARSGKTKSEIRYYVEQTYVYDMSRTLDEIRPGYCHVESCQETVPEALTAFLESDGFEDAIRKAVSLGGDSDTLAAITGSIAEAYYGITEELQMKASSYLDLSLQQVVRRWQSWMHKKNVDILT